MSSHKILKVFPTDIHLQNTLSKELGISKIIAQLLINRGIKSPAEADHFLNAKLKHLLDPFSFQDMHRAVEIIKKAIKNKERVMVFGDYDVDGITSLAVLKDALSKMGADVVARLPHRIKEGYGLSKDILRETKAKGVKVLVTVDCGISGHKEIAALRENNVEVIITDHHEPSGDELPNASAIINPKVRASGYGFRDLAGVGVAYKFAQGLTRSLLLEELDLVTLGTIADVVPLKGENRIIVREGLTKFSHTKRPGIKALMESSRLNNRKFSATSISYILGPRINASGRMGEAEVSLNLLMSQNEAEAQGLAKVIEAHNRTRQKIEGKIMQEAEDLIDREVNFKDHKVIVLAKEDWHHGVLGIVASKLADRFYRPTIVISLDGAVCKGSGRSIKNFHLFHALRDCKEFLNAFGGHAHAVGLLIDKKSIEKFKRSINSLAQERLTLEDLLPSLEIDMEVALKDLTEDVIVEIETLEPFGAENPEPLFYTRGLKRKGEPLTLARETLKFWVTDGNISQQVIAFGMAGLRDSLIEAKTIDLVYSPRIDTWNDSSSIILEAREIFFK
ncbi:MAG: single-stranded-DNA-specific exonuclease RecJ [Candidatus Omnitrophota bacterium]